jgi:hypothetical protein
MAENNHVFEVFVASPLKTSPEVLQLTEPNSVLSEKLGFWSVKMFDTLPKPVPVSDTRPTSSMPVALAPDT